MNVICGNKRNARFLVKTLHVGQYPCLLLKSLILEFKVKILITEDFPKFQGFFPGAEVITVKQIMLNVPCKACGQSDYAFGILPEQLLVHPRLIVKAVSVSLGHNLHEIPVAVVVLCQQNQVAHELVLLRILVKTASGCCINLAANYGLDSLFQTRPVKVNNAEHDPVIRYGQGVHSKFLSPCRKLFDGCCAIEKAVFCVYM